MKANKLEIKYRKIGELVAYANNARTHSPEQVEQIANSIMEFGFTNPVLIDSQGIIAGHGRVLAAQSLGIITVPTITLNGLSEEQRKAYIIADNSIALNAGWNVEMLKRELDTLKDSDIDLAALGIGQAFLSDIIESLGKDKPESPYSRTIEAPIYVPSGDKPNISSLCDTTKTDALVKQIEESDVSEEEKRFLIMAAQRHTVFHFDKIAEYYAHADAETQRHWEHSALIIIDLNKAIEDGYAAFTDEVRELYKKDTRA